MFSPGTDLCPLRAFQLSAKTGGGPPSLCNSKEQKLIIQNPRLQVPPAQGKNKREDTLKTSFNSCISQLKSSSNTVQGGKSTEDHLPYLPIQPHHISKTQTQFCPVNLQNTQPVEKPVSERSINLDLFSSSQHKEQLQTVSKLCAFHSNSVISEFTCSCHTAWS